MWPLSYDWMWKLKHTKGASNVCFLLDSWLLKIILWRTCAASQLIQGRAVENDSSMMKEVSPWEHLCSPFGKPLFFWKFLLLFSTVFTLCHSTLFIGLSFSLQTSRTRWMKAGLYGGQRAGSSDPAERLCCVLIKVGVRLSLLHFQAV